MLICLGFNLFFSEPQDGSHPILKSRHKLTGELVINRLKCAACELSKASRERLNLNDPLPRGKGHKKHMHIRKEDLIPGQCVSIY